ncbi:site-specific integrase [Dyadobacter sp. 3J3]|uniref:site-specific integrase n=1 Tax=Dyadobacter sp. 3J3 TaxID=2606600 RepID=UPI00135C5921|nr:site-specific integrase [Dyadobacter sp. 3J3]
MYSYSQDGITISSIQDIRKPNKDKKFPVKIRVTYKRDRKYYSTGKNMSVQEWESLPGTKSKAASELKFAIQTSFNLVSKVAQGLINDGGFSFELLNIRLGKGVDSNLNSAFASKIQILKKEERAGSQLFYGYTLSSIEKFAGDNISFNSVTLDWLKKYEKWMLDRNMSYSTIGIYMRTLRAIINEAKKAGIIRAMDYPFGKDKYQIPSGESRKMALTRDDIMKVIQYDDQWEATARYRDLWILSYLINGINIGDLVRLKDNNIKDGEIRFFRAKTIRTTKKKKEIIATLTPMVGEMIERWGVKGRKPSDYIFPYLTGKEDAMQERLIIMDLTKRINKKLKTIADSIGIAKFTTYSARHSHATVLKRLGVNIASIAENLGHPDVRVTEAYLDSFEKLERQNNAALLTNYPDDNIAEESAKQV